MPNVAKVLREEIARISRHEAKIAITPIRKASARMRPDVAGLKNRVAAMEKVIRQLNVLVSKLVSAQPSPVEVPEGGRAWISGRGVKSLRRRLGLSQREFGSLTGVTEHGVQVWESKTGMLKLREATKAAIMAVRGIGKTEARKRLDEMKPAKKPVKAKGKKAVPRRRK